MASDGALFMLGRKVNLLEEENALLRDLISQLFTNSGHIKACDYCTCNYGGEILSPHCIKCSEENFCQFRLKNLV